MGHFIVQSIIDLDKAELGQVVEESDFATVTPEGKFVQLKYISNEKNKLKPTIVEPGIYSISQDMNGLFLIETSFAKDTLLDELTTTQEVEMAIETFFKNIPLYKEFGIEVAKRSMLLYGPQGTGKTSSISKVIEKYGNDKRTAIVVWHTAKWESFKIKDFIKSFEYKNVDKLILVAEDLGGIESDKHDLSSDSSLLSLLDNQEKTFTIPTCVIATTNFPEMFMANIVNRPGRFDDKIKIDYPSAENRVKLLKFFAKEYATEDAIEYVQLDKCKEMSAAHLREAYIRCRLRSISLKDSLKSINIEIEMYSNKFQKRRSMGLYDDED